ncbi:hypothetical protein V5O48_002575 [Marasmius crinis-equi]|uniref:F-box domain-containing protein n=1 Tax=Marasmius crinis-equi TaxID=585013 RepID=A0ABR3FV80_9AGAR
MASRDGLTTEPGSSHTRMQQASGEAGYTLCGGTREEEDSYCTNGVDGILGTHELGSRARYLEGFGKGKGKGTERDVESEVRSQLVCTFDARLILGKPERISRLSIPVFPPEIFDIIISFLSDYPLILKTVMLVCKSWVPICRRHIYGALNFTYGDSFDKECPYPHLVRRLSLVSPYGHSSVDWIDPVIRNMKYFSSLDHLEMVDLPWNALWTDDGHGLLNVPEMKQVTKVFLGGVEVEYLTDIATFISRSFSQLHHLVLSMEVFSDGDEEDEEDEEEFHEIPASDASAPCFLPPPPDWEEFVIQDHPMYPAPTGYWWRWFTLVKFSGLRSIMLGGIPREDYPLFEAYVVEIGGLSLIHLGVAFASLDDLNAFASHHILPSCTNLESLRISQPGRTIGKKWGVSGSTEVFRRVFASFTARNLRTIALPIVEDCARVETDIHVEGALTKERFPALESIEFVDDF